MDKWILAVYMPLMPCHCLYLGEVRLEKSRKIVTGQRRGKQMAVPFLYAPSYTPCPHLRLRHTHPPYLALTLKNGESITGGCFPQNNGVFHNY